jgi:hypothetical protein
LRAEQGCGGWHPATQSALQVMHEDLASSMEQKRFCFA